MSDQDWLDKAAEVRKDGYTSDENVAKFLSSMQELEIKEKLEENLEYTAAKQLFAEISGLKSKIYMQQPKMNGLLLVAMRRTVNECVQRYQNQGLLMGESVKTTVSNYSKNANFVFDFSPKLKGYRDRFVQEAIKNMESANIEAKNDEQI